MSDLLTDEDIAAFHSKIDQILEALGDGVSETERKKVGNCVKSWIENSKGDFIVLKILPRHRFRVETTDHAVLGKGKDTFYRKDLTIEKIEDRLNL